MNSKTELTNKGFYSQAWANDLLRWFLREILYNKTWALHPYNKIIVAYDIIDQLQAKGYPWQAARVRNHLHRWMKRISCTGAQGAGDTPPLEEEEHSS